MKKPTRCPLTKAALLLKIIGERRIAKQRWSLRVILKLKFINAAKTYIIQVININRGLLCPFRPELWVINVHVNLRCVGYKACLKFISTGLMKQYQPVNRINNPEKYSQIKLNYHQQTSTIWKAFKLTLYLCKFRPILDGFQIIWYICKFLVVKETFTGTNYQSHKCCWEFSYLLFQNRTIKQKT